MPNPKRHPAIRWCDLLLAVSISALIAFPLFDFAQPAMNPDWTVWYLVGMFMLAYRAASIIQNRDVNIYEHPIFDAYRKVTIIWFFCACVIVVVDDLCR